MVCYRSRGEQRVKINHVLVRATDLDVMNHFWVDILGLQIGARPPFPFRGAWLYSDAKPLVHVVHDPSAGANGGAIDHVAFEGVDYDELIATLQQHSVDYVERDVPVSGEHQVFISGPDSLTVEMLFPLGIH